MLSKTKHPLKTNAILRSFKNLNLFHEPCGSLIRASRNIFVATQDKQNVLIKMYCVYYTGPYVTRCHEQLLNEAE